MSALSAIFIVPLALLLDRILGEPPCYHPLVGFGSWVNWLEAKINHGKARIMRGIIAWCVAVIPITTIVFLFDQWVGGFWLSILFGWLAIGWKSLRSHGLDVYKSLESNKLDDARIKTSYLVSRDTSRLDESDLSKATIESILENTSDAIIAPLFWLVLLGAPGVVLYRLANTLDAMWGYRNTQFESFGKASARMDDALNIIPARITALLFLLFSSSKEAWRAWKTQGTLWYSPNAGIVMASGAGALSIKLGGSAFYHGKHKERLALGTNQAPTYHDIQRAITLMDRSVLGFALLIFLLYTSPLVFHYLRG